MRRIRRGIVVGATRSGKEGATVRRSARGRPLAIWRQGTTLVAPSELPPGFRLPGLLGKLIRGEALPAPRWPRALR